MKLTAILIKTLSIIETEGNYLDITKNIYFENSAKSIINGKPSKQFKLKSETRHRIAVSPSLFNIVLEVLINTIR